MTGNCKKTHIFGHHWIVLYHLQEGVHVAIFALQYITDTRVVVATSNKISHFNCMITTKPIAHLGGNACFEICVNKFDMVTGQSVITCNKMWKSLTSHQEVYCTLEYAYSIYFFPI